MSFTSSYFPEKSKIPFQWSKYKNKFLQLRCSEVLLHLKYKVFLCTCGSKSPSNRPSCIGHAGLLAQDNLEFSSFLLPSDTSSFISKLRGKIVNLPRQFNLCCCDDLVEPQSNFTLQVSLI